MPIITCEHLTKEYRLGQFASLKDTVFNQFRRLIGHPVSQREPFKALDDVSFSVEPGEVLGIIGHNGAGKSTLLKLLAGITTPTAGRLQVGGRIAPLIEVGAGFVPNLTGRENVYLNGSILGLSRKAIDRKFDEIVDFAEMEEFIDTPVKRYSSGMQVKLAFSVATSIDAEILIVDEVLAVGDLAFQRKCFDRMEDLIKHRGNTVLLVSHNIRQVQRLCTRVIMLDHGRINKQGAPREVCNSFYAQNDKKIEANSSHANARTTTSGEIDVLEISFLDHYGRPSDQLYYNQDCAVNFKIQVKTALDGVSFGFGFHTTDFLYLTTHNSEEQIKAAHLSRGIHDIQCKISNLSLLPGVYSLRFGVTSGQAARTIFYGENLKHFQVAGDVPITIRDGFFALDADWTLTAFGAPAIPTKSNVESLK